MADPANKASLCGCATLSSESLQNLFHIPRGKDSSACLYCHESPDFWHGIRRSRLHRWAWSAGVSPALSNRLQLSRFRNDEAFTYVSC